MQLKNNRILSFICKKCFGLSPHDLINIRMKSIEKTILTEIQKLQETVENQNVKIAEQNNLIKILNKDIKDPKESTKTQSYANAAKNGKETLIIKPKEKQESNITKGDLKEKINPKEMAIGVENLREGREGAVIINCSNSNTKEKIREKVATELGHQYNVVDGVQKNPKLIIRGVEEDFIDGDDSMVLDSLIEQNDLSINDDSIFKVQAKYKRKGKVNKGNIILTVDGTLKNKICQMEKLNIGWRRCMVQEYFNIVRCFKCARYGHTATKCENKTTCYNCGKDHKTNDCNCDTLTCINCVETNNKFKKSLNVNHAVNDPECACYKKMLENERRKTKSI